MGERRRKRSRAREAPNGIPSEWLTAAAAEHAKGLHLALAIWMQAGSASPGTSLVMRLSEIARAFHFHPSQAGRALVALAKAGLVSVERRFSTDQPRVTITQRRRTSPTPI
jgi:DNA-binding MarR family transcriptional regulator